MHYETRSANRVKVLVHDGFGLWLCARRMQQGHFVRTDTHLGARIEFISEQLRAPVVGPAFFSLQCSLQLVVISRLLC